MRGILKGLGILGVVFLIAGCASYKTDIAIAGLREVIQNPKMSTEMSDEDHYLLVMVDTSFGKVKIKRIGEQKIKILSDRDLDEIASGNENDITLVYLQMNNRKEGKEVTISYTCCSIFMKNGETEVLHDHFCRGGMVLMFNKVGDQWEYKVEYKI